MEPSRAPSLVLEAKDPEQMAARLSHSERPPSPQYLRRAVTPLEDNVGHMEQKKEAPPTPLVISAEKAEKFRELFECPSSLGEMQNPIVLECGHSIDETSLRDLKKLGKEGERKVERRHYHVDLDRPVECPLDRIPSLGYTKSRTLKSVAEALDTVFSPIFCPLKKMREAQKRIQNASDTEAEVSSGIARSSAYRRKRPPQVPRQRIFNPNQSHPGAASDSEEEHKRPLQPLPPASPPPQAELVEPPRLEPIQPAPLPEPVRQVELPEIVQPPLQEQMRPRSMSVIDKVICAVPCVFSAFVASFIPVITFAAVPPTRTPASWFRAEVVDYSKSYDAARLVGAITALAALFIASSAALCTYLFLKRKHNF